VFGQIVSGAYTITPAKAGFLFTPASQQVAVSNANVSGVNFTATPVPTYSIIGTISPTSVGAGTTVTLTGAATGTTTADSSGNYSFAGLLGGMYTVTPTKAGAAFNPTNQAVTIASASVANVKFTGSVTPTLSMDARSFLDSGTASSTLTTPGFSTKSSNKLLLAFVATDYLSGTNTTVSQITDAGLTWTLVLRTNVQSGTAEIWRAFASSALNNVTVTATLSHSVVASMTVASFSGVDPSGTNGSGAIGATASGNARTGAPTAQLVTTRNGSWVFGVGNDYDKAVALTPGTGQTIVHQDLAPSGDTYWVQMQNNPTPLSGTTVTINDTAPTGDRYNLSICEILPAP